MRKIKNILIAPSIALFLTVILAIANLVGLITFPWWAVTSPLIALMAFYAVMAVFVAIFSVILSVIGYIIFNR